jgi:DNA-directed RNA polymerase
MNKSKQNFRKQNQAIVPNIVHSFDASNIALLVKALTSKYNKKEINLLTIHDCFATNANNVDILFLNVKLAFISLYSNKPFIENYHNFILEFIKKTGFDIVQKPKSKAEPEIIISYIPTISGNIKIPENPKFEIDKNFNFNVLASQYLIN